MTSCRTCQSDRLYLFLPLGSHPLANGFLRASQLSEPEPLFPLDVYACLECGLIQVRDVIPAEYFRHYVYIPSASDAMRQHFSAYARSVVDRFVTGPDALVVDIGCNDGLFLEAVSRGGARTLGIDPASNIVEMARQKGLEVVNEYFTPDIARSIRDRYGRAAVVTANNTFHHIGDLDRFTEGVRLLLDDDGVFVVEVPHALELVEQNEFDGVYHEHVSQFTVTSLVALFRRFDLEVVEVQRLDVHGGSMRIVARPRGRRPAPAGIAPWLAREAERGLLSASTYDRFRERVEQNRTDLLRLLRGLKQQGGKLAGYGASARGNTLLNYCGIGPDLLDYIVDRNPLKHGLYSPGMHIPVHGVERLDADPPQYLLLIAWNFADEIVRQQAEFSRRGGRFIQPIPRPTLLS